jgi:phosphoglycerate dehydrogenase-like enzyme
MEKIHVIGKISLTPQQRKRLEKMGVSYLADTDPISRSDFDEILKRVGDATVVLNNVSTPLPESVLNRCHGLKFIQTWSTGVDHIDLKYAEDKGIRVANVRNYSTEAVAEKTIGAMILLANDLLTANLDAKNGNWNYQGFTGTELKGKTLLTVGYGETAKRVSKLAMVFGMKVTNSNSKTSIHELNRLIERAHFITINCPLNRDTYHLIGSQQFELMKDVVLINYARGGIVDEDSLLRFLESWNVKCAALDVFEKEPPGKDNALIHHPRVFVTPHISWNTIESMTSLTERCIDNIESYIEGTPLNTVV